MRKAITAILFTVATMQAGAQDNANKKIQTMLVTAKMAGGCGIVNSMMDFHAATKLPGGDDFVVRFINTEMARLNISYETYFDLCAKSIKAYDHLWESLEST